MFNHKLNNPITVNTLNSKIPFKENSFLFAPMEGVTSSIYRKVIRKLYPEWDALCADFIRVPSNGVYPTKYLQKHIGHELLQDQVELNRTMVQILTSPIGKCLETVQQLVDLGVSWLDLNIGCPSGTVVKHRGGSFWLKTPSELFSLVSAIRKIHPHFFSVKMRLGFETSENFLDVLKGLEAVGVDAITVHARTRQQMYSTPADWSFITQAVQAVSIPIIANGDIWSLADAKRMFELTGCHSVMVARGALKSPWMVSAKNESFDYSSEIKRYFFALIQAWQENHYPDSTITKKIKELSRYIFDEMQDGSKIKRSILLSSNYIYQTAILRELV